MKAKIKVIWEYGAPFICFILGMGIDWFTQTHYWNVACQFIENTFEFKLTIEQQRDLQVLVAKVMDFIGFLPLEIIACKRAFASTHLETVRKRCFEHIRKNMVLTLAQVQGIKRGLVDSDLNIRIFRKHGHYLTFNDIDGCCSVSIYGDVKFDINLKEGMVSIAYLTRDIQYEIKDCTDNKYHLSQSNASAVSQLRFIVVVPIVDDGKVQAVIAIDSNREICRQNANMEIICSQLRIAAYELYYLVAS